MAANDELTAGDIKTLLAEKFREENVTYSERRIARAWSELGWTFTCAKYSTAGFSQKKALSQEKCTKEA